MREMGCLHGPCHAALCLFKVHVHVKVFVDEYGQRHKQALHIACAHARAHTHTHAHTHAPMLAYTHARTHAPMLAYTHAHTHERTNSTHTHTHKHIHTCRHASMDPKICAHMHDSSPCVWVCVPTCVHVHTFCFPATGHSQVLKLSTQTPGMSRTSNKHPRFQYCASAGVEVPC